MDLGGLESVPTCLTGVSTNLMTLRDARNINSKSFLVSCDVRSKVRNGPILSESPLEKKERKGIHVLVKSSPVERI